MSLGWHKKRALLNRLFPPPKTKRFRRRRVTTLPELHGTTPGDCPFCGNVCEPAFEPWTCLFCGVTYPVVFLTPEDLTVPIDPGKLSFDLKQKILAEGTTRAKAVGHLADVARARRHTHAEVVELVQAVYVEAGKPKPELAEVDSWLGEADDMESEE